MFELSSQIIEEDGLRQPIDRHNADQDVELIESDLCEGDEIEEGADQVGHKQVDERVLDRLV